MVHGEEVMNVARECTSFPESISDNIYQVEQFEPFWRISKSFGTDLRSLIIRMSMPHLANVELLRALGNERRVHTVRARQVH